jgi:hypothetical protein
VHGIPVTQLLPVVGLENGDPYLRKNSARKSFLVPGVGIFDVNGQPSIVVALSWSSGSFDVTLPDDG